MRRAGTVRSGVGETRAGWNLGPEQPANGPKNTLGGEGCSTVAKRVGQVQKDFSPPADGEVWGAGGVEEKKPIPPREINFKHEEFRTWIEPAIPPDHGNDVVGSGEGELPD